MPKTQQNLHMKKHPWLYLALLLTACTHKNTLDNNCISRFTPSASTPLIKQSAIDSANTYFQKNGLTPSRYQPALIVNAVLSAREADGTVYYGNTAQIFSYHYIN